MFTNMFTNNHYDMRIQSEVKKFIILELHRTVELGLGLDLLILNPVLLCMTPENSFLKIFFSKVALLLYFSYS